MELMFFYWLLNCIVYVSGEKGQQGQYSFPPTNPLPNSDITSDKYFSSQFQSQIPYFVTNNYNEMPHKIISSHNGKLSNISPMPILLTSTINYGDENLQRKDEIKRHINISSMPFNYNQTKLTNKYKPEGKPSRLTPHLINYNHPIDRMDTKISSSPETLNYITANQNPISKKMIISIENGKNQELDQSASFHNVKFVSTPSYFFQSTTEPAIPILRLSNEMDLDGSFSYEALGADQTHYVQHSRMENLGTDKEGPVVEGSYSYVGDNGQTYTVHYIADSNGYRATGDHLPVPPPIPEIIQRSIQYNLAAEIRQEPQTNYYIEHVSDNNPDNEKRNQNYYRTQRNLFTGQTPEAFSFGLLQAASSLQNNVTSIKNFTDPLKTNLEFPAENIKRNINYEPLEPQVTFRASQGAHSPLNIVQKPILPQLVNYEPNIRETENSKALWRWQYGLNTNTDKPNISKDSISRSFSEGDDIIINFSEMSPDEYTKIIKNYEKMESNSNYDPTNVQKTKDTGYIHFNKNTAFNDVYNNFENKKYYSDSYNDVKSTTNAMDDYMLRNFIIANNTYYDNYNLNRSQINNGMKSREIVEDNDYSLSTSSEISPNWFDYINKSYDSKGSISTPVNTTNKYLYSSNNYVQNKPITSEPETRNNENYYELKIKSNYENLNVINPTQYSNVQYKENNEFKPENENLQNQIILKNNNIHVTTPESTIQEEIKENIFLKNVLVAKDHDSRKLDLKKIQNTENFLETVTKSSPINTFDYKSESHQEIDPIINKAFDISNVLNLIDNKNIFESNRLLIKRKPQHLNNLSQKYGFNVDTNYDSTGKEKKEDTNLPTYNMQHHPQQQEIRGNLRNYKVLQRKNVRNFNSEENPSQNHQSKSIYSLKLPPLGRAGPSVKTYQPPIYF